MRSCDTFRNQAIEITSTDLPAVADRITANPLLQQIGWLFALCPLFATSSAFQSSAEPDAIRVLGWPRQEVDSWRVSKQCWGICGSKISWTVRSCS